MIPMLDGQSWIRDVWHHPILTMHMLLYLFQPRNFKSGIKFAWTLSACGKANPGDVQDQPSIIFNATSLYLILPGVSNLALDLLEHDPQCWMDNPGANFAQF